MPHTHAAAVVDRLLRRLASSGRQPELPSKIDEDVAHVGRTLARLQDVLVSLGTHTEAQVWMGNIKQITYDIEDLLDEFEDLNTHRIAMERLLDWKDTVEVLGAVSLNPLPYLEPFDNEVSDVSAIVGRDNDKAMIKDMLLQSNAEKLSVIPIVGLAGSGKTSLARLIFCDQGEGWNFDLRIWISLNRKLDLKKGSVIDKEKLIQQWIALEMIGSKHGSLPSYVHGEMCIQDLLSIYFLQVRKMQSIKEMDNRMSPTTLYMHNFVHDFALHVAFDDIIILDDNKMRKGKTKRQTFQYALLTHYRGQSSLSHSLLTRARALHLRNSAAITFHSGAFKLLKHLRVLNLSGCCIGELPASIGHLKCLRYLDVSGVPIQTLPSTVGRLTNLEMLDLSKTLLKELPCFVGNFLNLKHLNMQGCDKLQNFPAALGHLQRLEHLRLSSCNDVGELPDSVCNLHDLQFFDLSRCTELRHLPPLFGNLVNLEDLSLSSCFNLKQLPESFGNLYFLRFLDLSSCYELQQLPESLTKLDKLEVLILRRCCRLQNLPSCLANIKFLRVLDLAGCEALDVGAEMLTTNLEYLNLRRCLKLQTQPHCFENFTKLKFLNLSQCLRTTDCLQSVSYLFNLEYLNLSENFLDIPMCFTRLQKLHTLDLTGCRPVHLSSNVHKIVPDTIGKMTGLKFLLTMDPVLMACLPPHIRCVIGIDEHWHETTDELVIKDITGGPRGISIAEGQSLKDRLELRFLKLQWISTSQSDVDELVCDTSEDEVLEKLKPNQNLEHFVLVKYAGHAFPTWMMDNMTISLPYLSLKKIVMDECVGDDGTALVSSEFQEIKGTQEPFSTKVPHETKSESSSGTNISTQDGAHKVAGSGSSIIRKLFLRSNNTSENSANHTSSFEVSTPSEKTLSISHNLSRSKMPAKLPGVGYLSLRQDQMKVNRSNISHWSLVKFLGVIEEGNEFMMITEYVPNGTLREHLNDQHVKILECSQRMIIAIDVAIALTYLHMAVGYRISFQFYVFTQAREKFNEGQVNEILDYRLKGDVDENVLRDWLSLALRCAAFRSDDRPSIEEVGFPSTTQKGGLGVMYLKKSTSDRLIECVGQS
ncbi:hypothetical protein PR202_gb22823 [Eleusine coracana subsp. coracana]|uniref:Protein kinase domain-containing protein n=1 Tax=Eleusine coracana subsp. coracana TaxID=191504 RepID=A0AAV5FEL9_ELECO|nr:hypothetical protein PR202_gb22823 [Eleusine coracana subsp. coracana]